MEPHTRRVRATFAVLAAAFLLTTPTVAQAQLTITPPNFGRGFVVTEYTLNFPNSGVPFSTGPIGIAFDGATNVIISDNFDQTVYRFTSHTDGQTVTAANTLLNYSPGPAPFSMAQVKLGSTWHIYTSTGIDFQEISPTTGSLTMVVPGGGGLGMVPYPDGLSGPHAGHIFVAGQDAGPAIREVDPATATVATLWTGISAQSDGLTISPNGAHLILVRGDSLFSYNMTGPPVLEWSTSTHPGAGYDGVAFGLGTLADYVYVNCNNGSVYELGVPWGAHAGVDNELLTGGSRGDFIAVDPNSSSGGFPSVLFTQTDRVTRLDPPGGGWFGPPASTTSPITNGSSGVGGDGPFTTRLLATAPNPTPGSARVDFVLSRESQVRIGVLDVQGREVAVIENRMLGAGTHQAVWDGRTSQGPAAAGLYFVRMVAGGVTSTRSIALAH